mgnify:CR=1 FL=1
MDIIGTITPPAAISKFGDVSSGGVGIFLNRILQVMIIFAGIYSLFNLVSAGYAFMSAGDDPKKVAGAWQKIWQTLLGLAFAAGALVLAGIFGQLIFGDPTIILNPQIPAP